jgi:hypothetical protein
MARALKLAVDEPPPVIRESFSVVFSVATSATALA